MSDKNFINIFKKSTRWILLFIIGIFLFVILLNWLGKNSKNKSAINYRVKNKKTFSIVSKHRKKFIKPNIYDSKNNLRLKDIFNIPDKKYKKLDTLFIYPVKINNNGTKINLSGKTGDYFNSTIPTGEELPYFIKKLKFKGFHKKTQVPLSLIFISGKTALLEIGGKSYYVRTGENIGGIFILKIDLNGISYSDDGKIKYLNF